MPYHHSFIHIYTILPPYLHKDAITSADIDSQIRSAHLYERSSTAFSREPIHHNFIRPHITPNGKTPSEAAGITLKGNKKMLTLIQNAVAYSGALSTA